MNPKVSGAPRVSSSNPRSGAGTPIPGNATPQNVTPAAEGLRQIQVPRAVSIKQLADLMGLSPVEVIKDLMKNGVMASINQVVDFDTAAIVASDFGFEAKEEARPVEEAAILSGTLGKLFISEEDARLQRPRPPIVTIMGHVDHGKTSLLDAIRKSDVTSQEAGGITQHIGAYQTEVQGQKITFLDTPGHEAFTAMRARGAQATDIAVLVVAADDGVMPQTVEAIDHAKAAGVPIIVAVNKIDKPNANPDRVKQELAEHSLLIEEWGGDVICVPVSAKTGQGISDLLENILVVAEVADLKANPQRPAIGVIVEASLDSARGSLATVLVQTGTLKVGDIVIVGDTWGKVKAMFNDKGQRIKRAEPSTPAKIMGLNGIPQAGDTLKVVSSEKEARTYVQNRQREREREQLQPAKAVTLDALYDQIRAGQVKELNIILKTDVQGSIDPIRKSLERLGAEKVKVRILHAGTGSITESDVLLALASKGIIIGFSSRPEPGARRLAEAQGVDIRFYDVIYELVEDVEKALVGMLEPTYVDVVEGHAEVRQLFRVGKSTVAGVYVSDGKATRASYVRIIRGGETIYDSRVASLKHFKEDVREMAAGYECGVAIEGFGEFQLGDVLEFYRKERASVSLS